MTMVHANGRATVMHADTLHTESCSSSSSSETATLLLYASATLGLQCYCCLLHGCDAAVLHMQCVQHKVVTTQYAQQQR
jgi:hypothetical protein